MGRPLLVVVAAASLQGCFIEPWSGPRRSEDPLLDEELAAYRAGVSDAARQDRAARALGFSGRDELASLIARDCLADADLARYAAARGRRENDARRDLSQNVGVRLCGR